MTTISLPDGSQRSFDGEVTGLTLAKSISSSLAKQAFLAQVEGEYWDLNRPLPDGATVAIVKRDEPFGRETVRHDLAHVLAEAVQELFPGTKVTIGPPVADGFYYDFDRDEPFVPDDFPAIEAKMKEIMARNLPFEREEVSRGDALDLFAQMEEPYKLELIRDLPADETITLYRQGDWVDLCRGPHGPTTGAGKGAFKLARLAGAYWRGDSKNKMLQRVYAYAFNTEQELKAHLHMLEEAEKRDHRRLGKEMGLFHLQEEAAGSIFWHPKGWALYRTLESYMRRKLEDDGYYEIRTPQLVDRVLWERSGHWDKFRANMFTVPLASNPHEGATKAEIEQAQDKYLALKPMNCPGHVQIFNQGIKSYRDLPMRLAEFGACHRNEAHGALHGIMRVRAFTQDDAHIFCTEDQVLAESLKFHELAMGCYADVGFADVSIKLATRPDQRAGTDEVWDKAERDLSAAIEAAGVSYDLLPGEGAFYGPKLEYHLKDAIGRSWQCGTLQLDFVLPERLDASFVGEDGGRHRPVMLHRAIFGSFERFLGILIENFAGHLPLWMSPVQAVVATVVSEADEYAAALIAKLKAAGIKAEIDLRNEKINYKVRDHSLKKVPAILAVGKRDMDEGTVAVRRLGTQGSKTMTVDEAVAALAAEAVMP